MHPISKNLMLLLFYFISISLIPAQDKYKLSENQLKDLANQAKRQVYFFFDNVALLGRGQLTEENKGKQIDLVVKAFTPKGTVEERSKFSAKGKIRRIRDYLYTIKARGEQRMVLINYEIIDNITPNELIRYVNPDSSITYKGDIVVRQFYCKLNEKNKLTDKLSENCTYSDVTEKKIYIEIRLLKSELGMSWAVLIEKITVLSVK